MSGVTASMVDVALRRSRRILHGFMIAVGTVWRAHQCRNGKNIAGIVALFFVRS